MHRQQRNLIGRIWGTSVFWIVLDFSYLINRPDQSDHCVWRSWLEAPTGTEYTTKWKQHNSVILQTKRTSVIVVHWWAQLIFPALTRLYKNQPVSFYSKAAALQQLYHSLWSNFWNCQLDSNELIAERLSCITLLSLPRPTKVTLTTASDCEWSVSLATTLEADWKSQRFCLWSPATF